MNFNDIELRLRYPQHFRKDPALWCRAPQTGAALSKNIRVPHVSRWFAALRRLMRKTA